ncbi:MAG TPA: UMP kinase [Candidatus Kapabacteria bacterium]|mgnify:FL=1|nr:UMP kinase [Candidatus Kapabacteria bacterium]
MAELKYKRILLKLSGEALMGEKQFGIAPEVLSTFANDIKEIHDLGVQIAIVIGGGNIFRGIQAAAHNIHKVAGDNMGMLATVINCIAFQNALEGLGVSTRLQTAIKMEQIAEPLILRRAIRHLEKGRVVLFGAGTGYPYFTTDTAAVLRAVEIEADVVIKGTRVDGVFDSDPEKNEKAFKFDSISYLDVVQKNLKVMDLTAITLCRENKVPIIVLNINEKDNLKKALLGENIGSLISEY